MKKFLTVFIFLILSTLACISSFQATPTPMPTPTPVSVGISLDSPLPPGDPIQGELLFNGQVDGKFACSACHGVFEGQVTTCPNVIGLSTRAMTTISGYSAETYLRESIVLPDAFVVDGYVGGVMPQNFGEAMTPQQLADILAYLLTK